MEAATVYYLRVMVDRVQPYQPNPLPIQGVLGQVELVREAATLLMLVTVGTLAGRTRHARAGYTAVAFGVWDICYYLFLRIIGGWPTSLLDWDILFLLPLPWWGPVLAPVCIALLMIVGGTLASEHDLRRGPFAVSRSGWRLQGLGVALALYVFWPTPERLSEAEATRPYCDDVQLALFWVAFALMAAPVAGASVPPQERAAAPAFSGYGVKQAAQGRSVQTSRGSSSPRTHETTCARTVERCTGTVRDRRVAAVPSYPVVIMRRAPPQWLAATLAESRQSATSSSV